MPCIVYILDHRSIKRKKFDDEVVESSLTPSQPKIEKLIKAKGTPRFILCVCVNDVTVLAWHLHKIEKHIKAKGILSSEWRNDTFLTLQNKIEELIKAKGTPRHLLCVCVNDVSIYSWHPHKIEKHIKAKGIHLCEWHNDSFLTLQNKIEELIKAKGTPRHLLCVCVNDVSIYSWHPHKIEKHIKAKGIYLCRWHNDTLLTSPQDRKAYHSYGYISVWMTQLYVLEIANQDQEAHQSKGISRHLWYIYVNDVLNELFQFPRTFLGLWCILYDGEKGLILRDILVSLKYFVNIME